MDTVFLPPDQLTGMTLDSMNTASKAMTGQMMTAGSAANADQLGEARPETKVEIKGIEETGGWDAYEVWRRFIKEARDRRKGQPTPN